GPAVDRDRLPGGPRACPRERPAGDLARPGDRPAPGAGRGLMLSVLFTGYAPVHYACFRPLHEALAAESGIEVHVAGGTRTRVDLGTYSYDPDAMFGPFGIDPASILTV